MDDSTFGGRVRTRCVHGRQLSQRAFAASAGVDPITLSKVEAGLVAPTPPRRFIRCGCDMTGQQVYHHTESGGLILVDHLDPARDYWTRE